MATLVEVAAELEKLGYTTQIITGDERVPDCLNVFGEDRRYPVATVWPPIPPKDFDWAWGHSLEHRVVDDGDRLAAGLAGMIRATLKGETA
jgi:hypothetical protein